MNSLPVAFDAVLVYQRLNATPSCTVTSGVDKVAFCEGAKWNKPLIISCVEEKPVTTTVNPLALPFVNCTVWMKGTVAFRVMVADGAGVGVMFVPDAVKLRVIVMVPASVPVTTPTLEAPEKLACVLPAGMVKFTVLEPVVNCTVWSSPPTEDANVSVAVPVTSTPPEYGVASEIVMDGCCRGPEVAGNPMVTAGSGAVARGTPNLVDGRRGGKASLSAIGTESTRAAPASNNFAPVRFGLVSRK